MFINIFPVFVLVFYLAGAAVVVYIVVLVVQVLRLAIRALKKYLQS